MEKEAANLARIIASDDPELGIINGTEINIKKLQELLDADYVDIKKAVRTENDFCIYLEDEDGNLITISAEFAGIGSDKIKVRGTPCG